MYLFYHLPQRNKYLKNRYNLKKKNIYIRNRKKKKKKGSKEQQNFIIFSQHIKLRLDF